LRLNTIITEFFGDFSLIFAANVVLFYDLTKYLKKKYKQAGSDVNQSLPAYGIFKKKFSLITYFSSCPMTV
jgi:hypothetical protein